MLGFFLNKPNYGMPGLKKEKVALCSQRQKVNRKGNIQEKKREKPKKSWGYRANVESDFFLWKTLAM